MTLPPGPATPEQTAPSLEDRVAALEEIFAHPPGEPASREQVRALLRECVTVVAPGETLVIRAPQDWSPTQVQEYQWVIDEAASAGCIPIRAVVIVGDGLAVAKAADVIATFMEDVRVEQSHAAMGGTLLKTDLTHVPTGIEASARTLDEAVALLAGKIHRAHVAISGSQRHQVP